MTMLRKSVLQILLFTIFKIADALNQCSDTVYKELGDLVKRSPTYMYDAAPLCDRYLTQGWYRAGFHQIPTTAPWLTACGTLFPYWMDDTAPNNKGETKSVKVCQVGFSGPCERTHNIRMTNCGRYFVYELIPLDICSAAYCFEPDNTCVSDIPKNIEVKYHSVSWTTSTEGVRTHYDPDINLACHFDRLPDDALFYDVTWYVDDTEVLTNQTVSSNSSDVALLSGSQMVAKGKKANSMIHCVVGAVFKVGDRPCNTNSSGLFFAGIKVFIEETDSSWKGTYCESHTDPHMKTFDGKYYECQLDGTFVLYRNDQFEQEVQEKHHLCYPRYTYPRCSCAVAVRSGKDIFTVDICNSRTIINFPLCEDKTLNVIKKNDRYYKIIFPTGTMVEIKFISWPTQNDWQLNVDIFPSPSDVGKSSGLCGVLDGNYRNDFTRNDAAKTMDNPDHYHYHNPPNAFSESWRVKNNELNLFDESTYRNLESISNVYERVCSCKKIADDKPATIECNYGTYKNCKFVVGKKFHCMLNPEGQLRRKRDLRHIESLLSNSYERFESKLEEWRPKREAIAILKTFEEAEDICLNAFQNSQPYITCKEYISDLSNTSLENCISDVMMTGDDNFTKIHIEAALEQCSVFVVLNTTFQQTEPEITNKIETFCQNNCSGHGICKDGNCTCEADFAGSDCSFDLLGPPSITHISDFGLCDKSKETCEEITVFGKYFIENMNTNCYMKRKTYQVDGITVSIVDYEANLQERTLFEGFCPLEYTSDDHWVTEFTFNISNDGSRFTDIYFVYTYQSLCQEYQNNTGTVTFLFKDGFCYINNKCILDGSTDEKNKCNICNTNKMKYEWSFNPDHCFIDGNCYESGDINGTNPCSACMPTISTATWSPAPDLCFIDGICYLPDQTEIGSECYACDANTSRDSWTFKDGYCLINNECFIDGESNEMYPCQICDVAQTNSSWTLNQDHCLISEVCYKSGDINSTNNCSVCIPEISSTTWTLTSGMCFIDNTCYPEGQQNPSAECSICKSDLSRTAWTLHDGCFSTSLSTAANEQLTSTDMSFSSRLTSIDTATSVNSVVSTDQSMTHLQLTSQSIEEVQTTDAVETLTKSESPTTVELTTKTPILTTTITKPSTEEVTVQSTVSDEPSTESMTIRVKTTEVSIIGTEKPITPFTSESINEHTTSTKLPTTKSDKTTDMSTEESSENSGKPVSEQSSTTMFITTEQKLPEIETTEINIESTTELISAPVDGTFKSTTENHQQTPIADKTMSYATSKSTQSLCWGSPGDVTVVYHNVSWISITETANRTVHEPSINLRCNFSLFRDVSLHYTVEWYVDGDTLVKESQVNTTTIERSILSMQDLFPRSITAGTKIRCRVGVMIDEKQKPCTFSTSPGFMAGIKILNTSQTILRKGTAKIGFHLTIPYVSSIIETNGQFEHPMPLEVHSVLPDSARCEDSLGVDQCVIYISAFPYTESHRFESDLWRKIHVITVYHMDTHNFKVDSSETFGLKTIREGDTFWNDVFHHNVTINIDDQNEIWKGKFCGSKTDPHIYTFDGVSYENHISGDFILYRNNLFNQEFSLLYLRCVYSTGQDVFLIDVCREQSFIDYISCNDSVMQVNKLRDKLYKIVLPTGTFVLVTLVSWPIKDAWQLDIELFPSLSDVNNTYGLCGTLDGTKDNEFTRRDGYKDNVTLLYPNEFSRSWNVQDGENLLREPIINRQPISSALDHICTCTPNEKQCLYKTFKPCLMGHEMQCTVHSRTQNRISSIKVQRNSSQSGESQLLRKKRQTFPHVKTQEEAEDICFAAFQVSETYRMCMEHVSDLSNSSYVNCIIDLTMTGDVNITTLHVESAIQQCATFITLNDTLQTTNPDVTKKLKSFCPRNCSNHGYCIEGNCTCDQGYGGSDCSFDTLSAPEIWSTFPSNMCDKSTQSCSRMHFKGRYFIENIKKTCNIQRTLVRHDGSAIDIAHFEQPLTAHNLFRGSCLLPFARDTAWVTEYTLNVSYDGKEFTESIKLYVYQSECQKHIPDDGRDQFLLKEGFCFISNRCVTQGSFNSNDTCYMCVPTNNKYTWTQKTDCLISSSPTPDEFTISTMIYILIACIAVIILVVPVAIWKYRKSHGYKQFYRIDDHQKEINEELSLKFIKKSKKLEDYVPMTHID
uniref:Uncharacterized protein LOC111117870 isoform X2 n=1 Tax=Crassostrea virginica TaxID=6565 RepID=A0A8B8CAY4_CRAVI|nr:uncharacterized protein LOC111117870 isoform X2 [Crassostrea virginica]